MQLRFTKMHGLGNDYVYAEGWSQPLTALDLAAVSRFVSDRHRGIGGDGLIVALPPETDDAHCRMRMFNADGSEGQMCGNGIRCVCKLIVDDRLIDPLPQPLKVATGAGVLSLAYETDADGRMTQVAVDMGAPIFEPARVPIDPTAHGVVAATTIGPASRLTLDVAGAEAPLDATCVSFGNPHAVIFLPSLAEVTAARLAALGSAIEHHSAFPERVNVHFVAVRGSERVSVLHWERGSGATLACGTGATAVCVAAALAGKTGPNITAELPGGELALSWDRSGSGHVTMTGPATRVFDGTLDVSAFAAAVEA